jgi:hypothetical protein
MIRLVASAVAIVAFASAASAATLSDVSGSVLVDSGKGFKKVSAASDVPVGSRVMVTRGGKAVLAYADGCQKTLAANSITTVVKSGACEQSSQVAAQAGGGGLGLTPTAIIAGGVGVGAAAAIIVGASQDNDTPPLPISQ